MPKTSATTATPGHSRKLNRSYRIAIISITVAIGILVSAGTLNAQQPRFDVATSPQEDGYVTDGFFEMGVAGPIGVRVNYLNRLSYITDRVAETELSTDALRVDRTEGAFFVTYSPRTMTVLDSFYAGVSYVRIDETQDSTYILIDEIGEYGTEYRNARDAKFISPRLGGVFHFQLLPKPVVELRYTAKISPVYYFMMEQEMTLENVGFPKDTYTNAPSAWASPYLDQEITLRLSRWARVVAYHSYLYLPFETLVLAENGFDMVPADDPTTMSNLRLNGEFTIPLGESVSFNLGFGYSWSWTRQTADRIPDDEQLTTNGEGYLRVGASMWSY